MRNKGTPRSAASYRAARRNNARGSVWRPTWPGKQLRLVHGPVRPNKSRNHRG